MLLNIDHLSVSIDGLRVLEGITLDVSKGQLVAVVGANGAGKSTLLRTISGLDKPLGGTVKFEGQDITGLHPKIIADLGIAMVPEGKRLFYEMTVVENLKIGGYKFRKDTVRIKKNMDRVFELFPVLAKNQNRIASTFSGGEQQMITIGRGLMGEPKLLMIDELSLGLAPIVIDMLMGVIKKLNREGTTIILVEQNINQVLKIADYGYVIENGVLTLSGPGEDLRNNKHVKVAYLGL
ncbi:MAG: ABC transporter ATP-binding protein [Hungatella sp.]|jgi:branched-chain amino acid transport system ATP-binding protein|nr:ABC transporter ATP-binding protein [Hungatella sp.]